MGLGKKMVAWWEAFATRRRVETEVMDAEILGENEAAEALFRSAGFTTDVKKFLMKAIQENGVRAG